MSSKGLDPPCWIIDHQVAQLNQFIGRNKYAPADAVLRSFVPKRSDRPMLEARAAAVWALGMIHDGSNVPDLAVELEERLNDTAGMPPEDPRVRYMCALTLGKMRARAALRSLAKYGPGREWTSDVTSNACIWAIAQINGEALPPPPKALRPVPRDWFLVPN